MPKEIQNPKGKAKEKRFDLRDRLFAYAQRIVDIVQMIPKGSEYDVLRKQLMAAGTSVGANYEEADGAVSKKDCINKIVISRKEANESKYWLRLISGKILDESVVEADINETSEIIIESSAI